MLQSKRLSSFRFRALAALVAWGALLAPLGAAAQITQEEYAARRDSLSAQVGDGVVVAFGGRTPVDDRGTFFQLPAFHYLTGFDEPDAAFVMVVRDGRGDPTLFLTPIDPRRAFYYGRRPDSVASSLCLKSKSREHGSII